MAGTPSKVPKGAPPTCFPARVYVGDYTQVIAQKGDREGGPPWYQRSKYPTPLSFQWEGGTLSGAGGGRGIELTAPAPDPLSGHGSNTQSADFIGNGHVDAADAAKIACLLVVIEPAGTHAGAGADTGR